MAWEDPRFAFPNAKQYAFVFENAHLLLLTWDRDDAKFLFVIKEQRDDGLILDYPGQLYCDRVLDMVQHIFFVQVQEEAAEAKRYVLGSFFEVKGQRYGAYYEQDNASPDVALFRVEGEAPELSLVVPQGDEYAQVSAAFMEQHEDFVDIRVISE